MNANDDVSIIIANYSPFRIILRENDIWNPTLDDINYFTYDYVKLCRLSSFFDVGIKPFSMGICFDGSLILPAIECYKDREAALLKFNEVLGVMLLGGIYAEAVLPTDISYGSLSSEGYTKLYGGGTGPNANFHQGIRAKFVGTLDKINLLSPPSISVKEILNAYKIGIKISLKLMNLSPVLLLHGVSAFANRLWTDALVSLWTAIEQIINQIWTEKVLCDEMAVIEGRKNFLKDYRTWTTSAKIELLFQIKVIDITTYIYLNASRKARNDFVHNGKVITIESSRNSFLGLLRLMSLAISGYLDSESLNYIDINVQKYQRGELYITKNKYDPIEIKHWISIPPLPGDSNWGDKEYEIIEELVLHPIENLHNQHS